MLLLLILLVSVANGALPPTCDSRIYCRGPLLHTVQMAHIFNDSKTFVDLKMKSSENITLHNFQTMMNASNNEPTQSMVMQFVSQNFENGNELEEWSPPDFKAEPKFLQNVQDLELREFGRHLVSLWKTLARKIKPEVSQNPGQYSLIYMPNGFIIPGGRFKEIYYWDTYWIIRGLLISEMNSTARGMIENLMHLVKKIGHVPNGSRVYYTQRSQPPFLTRMVGQYMAYSPDYKWLKKNINVLEQELQFWLKNRSINVKRRGITYRLFHYNAPSSGPRPEAYREDLHTAENTPDPEETYVDLKSGAESGWDFSTRWIFDSHGGSQANLSHIMTRRVIPVDLNTILYDAFTGLAGLYESINEHAKAAPWRTRAVALDIAIAKVLWNEKVGVWLDYDVQLRKSRDNFYPSNVIPLASSCCAAQVSSKGSKRILRYLKANGVESFPGGIPTSLINSGEQWDYPNAWPPLQSIVTYGLNNTKTDEAKRMASKLAQIWVAANLRGYKESKEMFEKYDAEIPGKYGGGGEYTVQAGFGWTNGVILEYLETFGSTLTAE